MKNNWSKKIAIKYIKKYKKLSFSKDLALRVYTTQLLGKNKELVLHGGGNTSVKTTVKDIDSKKYNVLCVKGSGWNMADIEPSGLPRRPVGSRGTKRRRTLRVHGQNAYSRRPLSIHTPHGVAFPSGSRAPDFSRFRCPPGFSRALPETPVPGVLLERTRSNTPLTLI